MPHERIEAARLRARGSAPPEQPLRTDRRPRRCRLGWIWRTASPRPRPVSTDAAAQFELRSGPGNVPQALSRGAPAWRQPAPSSAASPARAIALAAECRGPRLQPGGRHRRQRTPCLLRDSPSLGRPAWATCLGDLPDRCGRRHAPDRAETERLCRDSLGLATDPARPTAFYSVARLSRSARFRPWLYRRSSRRSTWTPDVPRCNAAVRST